MHASAQNSLMKLSKADCNGVAALRSLSHLSLFVFAVFAGVTDGNDIEKDVEICSRAVKAATSEVWIPLKSVADGTNREFTLGEHGQLYNGLIDVRHCVYCGHDGIDSITVSEQIDASGVTRITIAGSPDRIGKPTNRRPPYLNNLVVKLLEVAARTCTNTSAPDTVPAIDTVVIITTMNLPAIEAEADAAIEQRFLEKTIDFPSDINLHLGTLRALAAECSSVTEMGVRDVVSSWAFVGGLRDGVRTAQVRGATPTSVRPKMVSVDLLWVPEIGVLETVALLAGIDFAFIRGDSAAVTIAETDLLFIDTWHVYAHLMRELAAHAHKTRKYIVMHDTTVDAWEGESVRWGLNITAAVLDFGYPEEEIRRGLWPAVTEFLAAHPTEWALKVRYVHNNGLTVLHRIGPHVHI